jgi:hypothetical protein
LRREDPESTRQGALAGTIAAVAYGVFRFGDGDTFVKTIDRTPRLFFDFVHYYLATASSFNIGENEANGYIYSPLLAIVLIPLTSMNPAGAMAIWGLVQAVAIAMLVLRTATMGPQGIVGGFASAILTLLSTATLHSLKWGQIGLILAVLMLESVVALARRQQILGGVLLGSAIALKFYPALVWPITLAMKRFKGAIATGLVTAGLLLLPSFYVLGLRRTRNFYRRLSEALTGSSDGFVGDPSSQAVDAWFRRTMDREPGGAAPVIGVVLVLVILVLVWSGRGRDGPGLVERNVLAGLALTCLVPFFVPTCWPLYFCTLPALILLTFEQWRIQPSSRVRLAALATLLVAGGMQTFPAVDAAGDWATYTRQGWLLIANLATVAWALASLAITRRSYARGQS